MGKGVSSWLAACFDRGMAHRSFRSVLGVLPVLALAACASHGDNDSDTAALEASHAESLATATGGTFRVEMSRELANVRHVEGRMAHASLEGDTARAKALSLFQAQPKLLGLASPSQELRVEREETSESGTHVRFQETVSGVPVRGAEVTVHFGRDGELFSMDARIVPGITLDVTPKLTADEARERATSELFARVPSITKGDVREGAAPELVVFAEPGREARLAWHHVTRAMSQDTAAVLDVTVDALTGEVLEAFDDLETIKVKGTGVLGDEKEFEATQNGTTFTMVDGTRPAQIRTFTAGTQQTLPGTPVTSQMQNSWDNVQRGKGAAVDAHFYAAFVYDYYKSKFGRNGIDGNNAAMVSTVHFGNAYDNAFWDGTQMAYGDGGTAFRALSTGIDVVAHEFTHGVTTSTSKLVYQGQPGALNEAISDILSTYIEHAYKPDDAKNWVTGENVGLNGPIRDLTNPKAKRQPSNMKEFVNTQQDNGGVHINSGIPNNAAYLMTMGGTNPYSQIKVGGKLGYEKAEKLWYEVETKYFQARTDFAGAATMTVNAATALGYTPADIAVVKCAWIAVGVMQGTCDPAASGSPSPAPSGSSTSPTPGPSPSGSSSTGAPQPGTPQGVAPTPREGLLSSRNDGCNQSGGGTRDVSAMIGVGLVLGALARRKRSR